MGLLVHTYDFKLVVVTFGGVLINGFAKDSSITIEYNSDSWTLAMGADGEGARSKSNDRSAKITFSLMPGAYANTVLALAAAADRAANLGARPLSITDSSTGTTHSALGAWVMKSPPKGYQQQSAPVEWVLETHNMEEVHGFAP